MALQDLAQVPVCNPRVDLEIIGRIVSGIEERQPLYMVPVKV